MADATADPNLSTLKQRAESEIEGRRADLLALSHTIHANPELSWKEYEAAKLIAETLREAGFAVEVGAYGVETAVEAIYGDGDLTVAVCAEYDALPGIGHGCGHNVIASAGVGAALGLAAVAADAGLRVKLLGTPAEEHGGGKVAMLEAGAWEDADFSLMVHGIGAVPGMTGDSHSARSMRSRTAARRPTSSRTAPSSRSSCAYDLGIWRDMKQKVLRCFEAGAVATGCTWEWRPTEHPYAPLLHDDTLADLWDRNFEARGRVLDYGEQLGGGSTDMGNVSLVVPSIHPLLTFRGKQAPAHNPAFTEIAGSAEADDAILDGAATMAATVLDVALTPELRADYQARKAARPAGATQAKFSA